MSNYLTHCFYFIVCFYYLILYHLFLLSYTLCIKLIRKLYLPKADHFNCLWFKIVLNCFFSLKTGLLPSTQRWYHNLTVLFSCLPETPTILQNSSYRSSGSLLWYNTHIHTRICSSKKAPSYLAHNKISKSLHRQDST